MWTADWQLTYFFTPHLECLKAKSGGRAAKAMPSTLKVNVNLERGSQEKKRGRD